MTYPTGALSVVFDFIYEARKCERRAEIMVDSGCWNSAVEQRQQAEKLKVQAGVEVLLWVLAVLKMPVEPNPWEELLAKQAKESNAEKESA